MRLVFQNRLTVSLGLSWLVAGCTSVVLPVGTEPPDTGVSSPVAHHDAGSRVEPDAGSPVHADGGSPTHIDSGTPVGVDGGTPAPSAPETLATLADEVIALALDPTNDSVFFSVYLEGIDSVPAAGGTTTKWFPSKSGAGFFVQNALIFDVDAVYWVESQGGDQSGPIMKAPLGDGAPTLLASSSGFISGLAIDSNNVYWVDQDAGTISSVPKNGGSVTTLTTGLTTPSGLVLSGDTFFFTDAAGDLLSVPTSGGGATTLETGPTVPPGTRVNVADWPAALAVDGENVYYSVCPIADGASVGSPSLNRRPLHGGPVTKLAAACAAGLTVDSENVYWTTVSDGTINEVPIAGGAVRVLASGQSNTVGPVVDATSVYWGTGENIGTCGLCPPHPLGTNAVMRVAK